MKRRAMGYRYYRGSWQAVMQLAEPSLGGLIERRAGLVEEQIIGPAQQGPADRQALFLPGLRGRAGAEARPLGSFRASPDAESRLG